MLPIVYNPVAGTGYALQVLEKVCAALEERKIEYRLFATEAEEHATELVDKLVKSGEKQIFVLGGDGTLWEAVQALPNTDVALGIIPGGTGNDFVKTLGLSKDPVEAVLQQLQKTPRPCDVVRLNQGYYLNVAGTGFDVETLRQAERFKRLFRGILPYLCGVVATIFKFRPLHLAIEADGETYDGEYTIVSVGNGQYFGGGMRPTPRAKVDDGVLDLALVKGVRRIQIPFLLPSFIKGTHLRYTKLVKYIHCRRAHIKGEGLVINIDGNLVPCDDVDIEMVPGGILLFV